VQEKIVKESKMLSGQFRLLITTNSDRSFQKRHALMLS